MRESTIYAATEPAKEMLAKGEYKRECTKGCACGAAPAKQGAEGDIPKEGTPAKK
jgi:hypothetical protein